ncbi:MAG: glutamine--fructose-6-phosphate transaminase (isomerizing) [Clostridia bacterium]|nr:glutamine--fructose-6-phosphate transaminase (isomerizing) [Clostridia bacterium]
MCGIIGYIGGGNAAENVLEGLRRLEYRGYDSAGLAVIGGNGKISVVKRQGRVEKLAPLITEMRGCVGIGHTRWATHGRPCDANAHPHSAGAVTVVHNGIIENYAELKAAFIEKGETFFSETDSEVLAKLVNKNFSGDILTALAAAVKVVKGSYALMAICENTQAIAVAKSKSSVILGFGDGENFCASDEPALAGKCKNICSLEDGDIALITRDKIEIFDSKLKPVKRKLRPNVAVSASLDLCGCPHYMLKELKEVPASVKNTISAFYDVEGELKKALDGVNRIIIVGCGTAYHAGLLGKRYFESFARVPVEVETAGEFRYKDPVMTEKTAVFAISQSGETADTVEAARLALSMGAKVVAVTNAPYSQLTRLASVVVPVAAGPEICVAATKSYTGQITALYLAALAFAGKKTAELEKMPGLCQKVIEDIDINTLAQMCARSNGVYFLGKDLDYAVALEGSLKLKEVSYIPSEGYPAGELKHGTLALIDGNTVSVALMFDKALAGKCENAVEQVLSRGGRAAVITNDTEVYNNFSKRCEVLLLPECDKYLSPLISAVVVQAIAYETAVILGRDPDKPRNLAKSVTVE